MAPTALVAALALHGCSDQDEVNVQTEAIFKQVPIGTPWDDLPAKMHQLGFSCAQSESHLSCEREDRHWLVCGRLTRAILLPLDGRLANVLVNVGRFC